MSSIMRARQRILFRSNSIVEPQQQVNRARQEEHPQQIINKKKFKLSQLNKNISKNNSRDSNFDYKNLSPQFPKTQRLQPYSINDQQEILSQRNSQIPVFINKKKKTKTSHVFGQNPATFFTPDLHELSFTDNQGSFYNQSPVAMPKKIVHSDKIPLLILSPPIRICKSPIKPKQCLKEYTQKIIDQQLYSGRGYIDEIFPPRPSIIFIKRMSYQQEGLTFERLTKIYQHSSIEILQYSEPTYLIQGKYTSPNIYSALTILAEDPVRVAVIFSNQQANAQGIYYLQFCKEGVWRYIIIDDYMPVKLTNKRTLLFLHTYDRDGLYEIWPCLIEKAMAKIYGTYQNLLRTRDYGIKDIMKLLTGYPVSEYTLSKDFRSYLIIIDAALKRKQIVVLEQISPQLHETARIKNIDPYRSYQLLQIKKNHALHIRNFNQSDLITKLSVQEALIFTKLLIFRNQQNYTYMSQTLRHKSKHYCQLKVIIQADTKCYWQIWQNIPSNYKKHLSDIYKNSSYEIRIKKEEEPQDSRLKSEFQQIQQFIITQSGRQIQLIKGKYNLIVHLCQTRQTDFTISYYGDHEIQMERVKTSAQWLKINSDCLCYS